jgi:hypothetical protein
LRVSSSTVEETAEISSSDDNGDDDSLASGLPEFGADGLYHITNEDEYK